MIITGQKATLKHPACGLLTNTSSIDCIIIPNVTESQLKIKARIASNKMLPKEEIKEERCLKNRCYREEKRKRRFLYESPGQGRVF